METTYMEWARRLAAILDTPHVLTPAYGDEPSLADVIHSSQPCPLGVVDCALFLANGAVLDIPPIFVQALRIHVPVGAKVLITPREVVSSHAHEVCDATAVVGGEYGMYSPPPSPEEAIERGGGPVADGRSRAMRAMSEEPEETSEAYSRLRRWRSSDDVQELAQPASFGAAMDDLHAGEYSFGNNFAADNYTSPSTTLLYATPDASRRGSHASAFDDAMETDPTPTSVSRNATQSTAETATSSWTSDTTASYHTARSPSDTRSATSFIPASSTARLPSSSSRSQPRQTSSYATPAAASGRANGRSRSQSRPRTSDARTVRFPTPEEEPVLRMPGSYVGSGQGWHSPEVVRPQVTRMASQGVLGLGGSKSNFHSPCLSARLSSSRLAHVPGPAGDTSANALRTQKSMHSLSPGSSYSYTMGKPGTPEPLRPRPFPSWS